MITRAATVAVLALLGMVRPADAHNGPPFPIVSDRIVGAYRVSIWTDPDTTDDAAAGGQFWVRLDAAHSADEVAESTRATVTIRPTDRGGPELRAAAVPVRGAVTNQFAALRMDHEGPYAVRVAIDGPAGAVSIDAAVMATYDLRPSPYLLAVYVAPFVLVGLLWGRLILRRRQARQR
jgi:hypothetical protein